VGWELRPELAEDDVQAALLAAVERLLVEDEPESAWWRSGFDELSGGPAPEQAWRDAGVVEP
jgi:hypothetical protein